MSAELLIKHAKQFPQLVGREHGVNRFTLEAPPQRRKRFLRESAVALFRLPTSNVHLVSFDYGSNDPTIPLTKTEQLEVPEDLIRRLTSTDFRGSLLIRTKFEMLLTQAGMPYLMLTFGTERRSQQNITELLVVAGITPTQALAEVKQAVANYKRRLN